MMRKRKLMLFVSVAFVLLFNCFGAAKSFAEGVEADTPVNSTNEKIVYAPGVDEAMRSNPVTIPGRWIYSSAVGKWWYRHDDGSYTTNDWEYINGHWYHFDSSGWMQTGWLSVNDIWFFLRADTGAMVTGWYKVQNQWYFFKPSGMMVTGWYNVMGYTYYFTQNGQYRESTRRALVLGKDHSTELDVDGWCSCFWEMSFKGDRFESVVQVYGPTMTEFNAMIREIAHETDESDITYICITGDGDQSGNITIGTNTVITGQSLHTVLDQLNGKVIVFLSCNYSGTIIDRGEANYPHMAFLSSFIEENRSGELIDDKYIVICSSESDELSASYPFENSSFWYSAANRCWISAGGWDPLFYGNLQSMYADFDSNSIVSLDELYTYSSHILYEQHVVVYSDNSGFTIFARN